MDWNLAYDGSAAIVLMAIVIWYYCEKRVPMKSQKIFASFVILVLVETLFEMAGTLMSRNPNKFSSMTVQHAFNVQVFILFTIPLVFTLYVTTLVRISKAIKRKNNIVLIMALAVDILTVAYNFITKDAFIITDNDVEYTNAMYPICIIDGIVLIGCVAVLLKRSKQIALKKALNIFGSLDICFVAIVIQLTMNEPIANMAMAVLCLTLFYYLQNPDSITDSVTNQFDRKFMGQYIDNLFYDDKRFGLIVVALDDFKFVNKTYGVDNGDELLRQVGTYLDSLDCKKRVFRYGSDQFAVTIEKNVDKFEDYADEIQGRFKHPWYLDANQAVMMSSSMCCIECPKDVDNYGALIEVIDYSMAVTKKTRKGSITKSVDIELDSIRNDKAIEKEIKLALDRDEIMVYYQPIYSVEKGCYNSAEALVRVKSEEMGFISPEIFIPLAEKNGMIIEMGDMIFEKVCKFIHDFKLKGTTVEYIEVNISPVQLMQLDFVDKVKNLMEKYEVTPDQINIEITETATMGSVSAVAENIQKLVDYGIKFSLDDYGSGNANIDYINRMPFSIIKIDKYIIWDAFKNDKAGITLEYTIGMLNALELSIVAEGVETEQMKEKLVDFGCHYMQGWYYSKAVSDTEFVKLLAA